MLRLMLQPMARFVWWFAESAGISLGRFAPWIFGLMIGCHGVLETNLGPCEDCGGPVSERLHRIHDHKPGCTTLLRTAKFRSDARKE